MITLAEWAEDENVLAHTRPLLCEKVERQPRPAASSTPSVLSTSAIREDRT